MNKYIKLVFTIFFITSINTMGFSHNHFPITTESKLLIERGKIAYQNNCVSCHMVDLSGAKDWKGFDEDGHRKAPPLNGTGHTWHHDDETLHAIIKYGLLDLVKNYEGKMMGFGNNLSDKDIDSVLAYIKSFWPEDKYNYQINLNK